MCRAAASRVARRETASARHARLALRGALRTAGCAAVTATLSESTPARIGIVTRMVGAARRRPARKPASPRCRREAATGGGDRRDRQPCPPPATVATTAGRWRRASAMASAARAARRPAAETCCPSRRAVSSIRADWRCRRARARRSRRARRRRESRCRHCRDPARRTSPRHQRRWRPRRHRRSGAGRQRARATTPLGVRTGLAASSTRAAAFVDGRAGCACAADERRCAAVGQHDFDRHAGGERLGEQMFAVEQHDIGDHRRCATCRKRRTTACWRLVMRVAEGTGTMILC